MAFEAPRWSAFLSHLGTTSPHNFPWPPIFLRFAFYCWRIRVFALDPVARAARTINRVAPLRYDPFQPELAGMLEHEWPVFLIEVLIEPYARRRMRQYALKRGLAHGKRLAAQTVPVELKKIVERGVMRHEKGSGGEFWPICMGNRRGQFPS